MNKIKKNITLINLISSFILQVLTLLNGFIISKIVLTYFGSDVNGLVSSLTKFLSYISIFEGGITGVVMASLYKPLNDGDNKKVSSILKTTTNFYKKLSFVLVIYTLILALIYPIVFKTNFSYFYIFFLTIILSLSSFVQYNFSLTSKTFLRADKKVYFVSFIQSTVLVINILLSYISVKIFPNIHFFKLLSAIIFAIQPLIYNIYIKKHYTIDKDVLEDKKLLKSRWDGFSINVASFIHTNTDILILSLFTNMITVSIYSVYALIASGLRTILSFLSVGMAPTIGQLYSKGNIETLDERFNLYEFLVFFLIFLLFSVTGLLITPFVMIYTSNITDANYYQPLFGYILVLSEAVYLIKYPHMDLAYSANKFKQLKIPSYIEAFLNITLSLILLKYFGIIGVVIATLISMIFTMIYYVWFTKKNIYNRKQSCFYKKLVSFSVILVLGITICYYLIPSVEYNWINWIWHGIVYTLIFFLLYLLNSYIFFKRELKQLVEYIKK